VESSVTNPLYRQQSSPVAKIWERPDNRLHAPADPRFPYALTTYRLTEHHAGGFPTCSVPGHRGVAAGRVRRNLPRARPVDRNPQSGLGYGLDFAGRGRVKALVTERVRPLRLDSQMVHEVGLVWHFGWEGFARGDIANILSAVVEDPNTSIHEGKAFTCNLRRGRREAMR
jgi:formate dehydrogenase major subunit